MQRHDRRAGVGAPLLGLVLALCGLCVADAVATAAPSPTSPADDWRYDRELMNTRWEPVRLRVGTKSYLLPTPTRVAFTNHAMSEGNPRMQVFEGGCSYSMPVIADPKSLRVPRPISFSNCMGPLAQRFVKVATAIAYRRSAERLVLSLPGAVLELRQVGTTQGQGTYVFLPEQSTGPLPSGAVELSLTDWRYRAHDGCNAIVGEYLLMPDAANPRLLRLRTFGWTLSTAAACGNSAVHLDGATVDADGVLVDRRSDGTVYVLRRETRQ